jgi:hypothetical protein
MSDEVEIPKDAEGILAWAKKNATVLLLSFLGVGGTGTGIGFSDALKRGIMDSIVHDLDSTYNIKPLPAHLDQMIIEADKYRRENDSIITQQRNEINYLKSWIANVGMNHCWLDTIHKVPVYVDTCRGRNWVEWDGYIYGAEQRGREWWIYQFQWQVAPGARNDYMIDPLYYELR